MTVSERLSSLAREALFMPPVYRLLVLLVLGLDLVRKQLLDGLGDLELGLVDLADLAAAGQREVDLVALKLDRGLGYGLVDHDVALGIDPDAGTAVHVGI